MAEQESQAEEVDHLAKWRQGDYSLDVGGFLYANTSETGENYDAEESTEGILGLIVISQTCDIVRRSGGREYITVCPLIAVEEKELRDANRGRKPYLIFVENTADNVFADLRRVMSVHKDIVATWQRHKGFSNQENSLKFAAALERKFGQFAFPDEFEDAIKQFKSRVWERHNKTDSIPGKIYRSLAQIRFRAHPDWDAEKKTILVIAVMKNVEELEATRAEIANELENQLANLHLPENYAWAEETYVLAAAKRLTAEDIISSQRGDFDYLCY